MAMKKQLLEQDNIDLELSKAVAQAWLAHSDASTSDTKEFDVRKGRFKHRPSRFKIEAAKLARQRADEQKWDFGQSLFDPYEIVAVSKRLEFGLVLDETVIAPTVMQFASSGSKSGRNGKRARESRNSLKKLLHRSFSRRLDSS